MPPSQGLPCFLLSVRSHEGSRTCFRVHAHARVREFRIVMSYSSLVRASNCSRSDSHSGLGSYAYAVVIVTAEMETIVRCGPALYRWMCLFWTIVCMCVSECDRLKLLELCLSGKNVRVMPVKCRVKMICMITPMWNAWLVELLLDDASKAGGKEVFSVNEGVVKRELELSRLTMSIFLERETRVWCVLMFNECQRTGCEWTYQPSHSIVVSW